MSLCVTEIKFALTSWSEVGISSKTCLQQLAIFNLDSEGEGGGGYRFSL